MRGRGQTRQLSAFDRGNVLPDRIDFVDVGAASQQQPRGFLLLGERDRRRGNGVSADAPPESRQITRSFSPASSQISAMRLRPVKPAFIGHRMPAGTQFDQPRLRRVAVLHVDATGRNPAAQEVLDGARHRAAGLPRPDHEDALVTVEIVAAAQHLLDRGVGSAAASAAIRIAFASRRR